VAILLPLSTAPPSKAAEIATKEKAAGMIQRVQDKFDRQSLDSVTANKVATFNDRDLYACICGLDDVSLPKTPPTLMDQEFANREKGMQLNRRTMEIVNGKRSSWTDCKRGMEARKCCRGARGDCLAGVGV
jgi:hypothetical protein